MLRLDLVVGPNGAGKSTFVRLTLTKALPANTPFVNADEIAARRWPEDPSGHSYDAAKVASATREALLEVGEPFIAETVFSHESNLELIEQARAQGFTVFLHVVLVPVELSVVRVAHRVAAGGHSVPEDKIRARHERLWPLVAQAALGSDFSSFYDNSAISGPRIVAQLAGGVPVGAIRWPTWAAAPLPTLWPDT